MILEMLNPVTHAVGNCAKRVILIVSSVIFFQTPASPINSLGKFSQHFDDKINKSCCFLISIHVTLVVSIVFSCSLMIHGRVTDCDWV